MAVDESLAARIQDVPERTKGVEEQELFGGLCFLLHVTLLVGVWKDSLVADEAEVALRESHVGVFDLTGRPMRNWVLVGPEGGEDDDPLRDWVRIAGRPQRAGSLSGVWPTT